MDNDICSGHEESAALTVFKGVIGAVIGSVPSMFLWVVLGKAGYVAALSGFFMILGEMYACDFMTRKSRQMNIEAALIICAVVMIAAVYICERIIWSWELTDLLQDDGLTFSACFWNFGILADDLDIKYVFRSSLIRSYIFAALGAVAGYWKLAKK